MEAKQAAGVHIPASNFFSFSQFLYPWASAILYGLYVRLNAMYAGERVCGCVVVVAEHWKLWLLLYTETTRLSTFSCRRGCVSVCVLSHRIHPIYGWRRRTWFTFVIYKYTAIFARRCVMLAYGIFVPIFFSFCFHFFFNFSHGCMAHIHEYGFYLICSQHFRFTICREEFRFNEWGVLWCDII